MPRKDQIRLYKPYESQRTHFILRLKERYEIEIDNGEYDKLCEEYPKNFKCFFRIKREKSIGTLHIQGKKVWCLYSEIPGCFSTCFPPPVENDERSMIDMCFGSMWLNRMAHNVFDQYLEEKKNVRVDFSTRKEAALWYFENTVFANWHIHNYIHGSLPIKSLIGGLGLVVKFNHPVLRLQVVSKKPLHLQRKKHDYGEGEE